MAATVLSNTEAARAEYSNRIAPVGLAPLRQVLVSDASTPLNRTASGSPALDCARSGDRQKAPPDRSSMASAHSWSRGPRPQSSSLLLRRSVAASCAALVLYAGAAAHAADDSSKHFEIKATQVSAGESGLVEDSTPQTGITEVVVTASRRAENVQRSALSIQAISADELTRKGLARPEDLSSIAAGVSVATGGNYVQTYIRGVGNYSADGYAEGAVAYNIDGVYVSRPWASRGAFFDLDRVEVLKGPQGTLYGRNASGGAINFLTAKPKLGQQTGFVELEAGNYDLMRGAAAVNMPIGDTLALRASGQIIDRDGYLSDGYDDDEEQSARLHLLWEPGSDLSVLLTGSYQHVGGEGAGSVVNPKLPGSQWRGVSDPAVQAIAAAEPGIGGLLTGFKNDGELDISVYSASAEINWNLGPATLTILPAYRDGKFSDRTYNPGFRVEDNVHDKQTSLEVRLGGDTGALKWVAGGYYFNEDQGDIDGRSILLALQGVNAQAIGFSSNIRSYAAFGQATLSVSDAVRLTGGIRYTDERKEQDGLTKTYTFPNFSGPPCNGDFVFDPAPPQVPLFCRLDIPLVGDLTYKNVTWKGGFEYDVGPQSMLYANVSTGFKSGGFFAAPPPNTFRPEKLTAYETGIKNRFFDNRLQLNLEGFYWEYKDHQESHLGPTSVPGFFTFITENAGSAKSYGADLEVVAMPTRADQLSLKVQYNKSKYDSFTYSHPTAVFGPPATGCNVGPITNGTQAVDCSGFQLVRTPTWTGTAGYDHTFDLGSGATVVAGISTQFASSSYLSIDFLPSTKQSSYATADADLSYTTADEKLTVTAYARNVTNEGVLTNASRYPFVSSANPLADPDGLILAGIRPPRTFGGRVRYNF